MLSSKSAFHLLFLLPKSSFGWGKIASRIRDSQSNIARFRALFHVGNNISENYPRRIGQGLNDASCMLNRMLSSLMGLPNPAWVSLGNVVSHMGAKSRHFLFTMKLEPSQPTQTTSGFGVGCILPKSSFGGAWNLR